MSRGERRTGRTRSLFWAVLAAGLVGLALIASPFVVLLLTRASLDSDPVILDEWATPPRSGEEGACDLSGLENIPYGGLESSTPCRWLNTREETECAAVLEEHMPAARALDECSDAGRIGDVLDAMAAGALELRMAGRVRDGGGPCVEAALDHYRRNARVSRGFGFGLAPAALDEASVNMLRCAASVPSDERRAVADRVWTAANELAPPHRLIAEHLSIMAPTRLWRDDDSLGRSFESFLEARRWTVQVDALLSQGPIPAMTADDPLESFDPGEAVEVAAHWLRLQAELRGFAVWLARPSALPAAWQTDLDARGLAFRRRAHGCVAFVALAFPDALRSDDICRGASPEVAARLWLGTAIRRVLAYRNEHGAWPDPITEPRMPVGDRVGFDPAWETLGISAPRHPGVSVSVHRPDPSAASLRTTDLVLHAAYLFGDGIRVGELPFGTSDEEGGEPIANPVVYQLSEDEVVTAGFCRAPCP